MSARQDAPFGASTAPQSAVMKEAGCRKERLDSATATLEKNLSAGHLSGAGRCEGDTPDDALVIVGVRIIC